MMRKDHNVSLGSQDPRSPQPRGYLRRLDIAETENVEASFPEMLHRGIVVRTILVDVHRIVERILESQALCRLQPRNVAGRDVPDRRWAVRPRLGILIGGDYLDAAFPVVRVRVIAGALDPQRPDQIEEFLEFMLVAMVSVPAGDMEGIGEVDAAAMHLIDERDLAELREPSFDDREMPVGEIRKRRTWDAKLIGAKPRHDASHHAVPLQGNDCGKAAAAYVVNVVSAASKPCLASRSKSAALSAFRSVGYSTAADGSASG